MYKRRESGYSMIRILHTADWHIDSPLRSFPDLQRRQLRASLLELPGKIAELCLREGCDLVLLAGDVFDGPYTREGYEAVYRALERMEVPVFLAPGNHDPYRPGSPWTEECWPENVYLFRQPELTSYSIRELQCRVYGAAFTGPESSALLEDFRADCDERHALLVLHGDPTNPASPYNPITTAQLRDSGLDYAALGHIHASGRFEAGAGLCAWPGCPMGRGFDETGTKGVLIAELEDAAAVRFVPLDVPRFFSYELDVLDDPMEAMESVLGICADRDHIRVRITGEVRPEAMDRVRAKYRQMVNLTILDETVPPGDLWAGAGEDSLTGLLFGTLRDAAREADPAQARQLELAARLCRRILDGREVELP